jgi:hypothetical protein
MSINGAFLKTQKHKNIGHKDTNLCLFNPIFNPIICMSVIKTQICRTSPPRSANLCPDISLTYIFISPLNVPSLVTEKSCTPPPHAAAARRHRCLCRTLPLPAATTSLTTPTRHRRAARRTPPPPSRTTSLTTTVRPRFHHPNLYLILHMRCVH